MEGSYSPEVLDRMIYASVHAVSFRQAEKDLAKLSDLKIGYRQLQRWSERIGKQRIEQRTEEVEHWSELSLPEMTQGCPTAKAPEAVMVSMDGGRMQIREDSEAAQEAPEEITAQPLCDEDRESNSSFWKESKIGCLATFQSQVHTTDPCAEIPANFLDPPRILKLSREICRNAPQDNPPHKNDPPSEREESQRRSRSPQVLVKSVVATKLPYATFGLLLAAAAWMRGFAAAARKSFVADGAKINWTIWRRHFSQYTPILDLIHAISRVFAAAMAGRAFAEGWPVYCRWAQWLWSGQVAQILVELEQRCQELGLPEKNDSATSPRRIVADALTYLRNNQDYMKYHDYRRQGLPITSSLMESTVKQVSRRVKGTEKFWSATGADPILQLRADYISETEPMTTFWENWQKSATGYRNYATAV